MFDGPTDDIFGSLNVASYSNSNLILTAETVEKVQILPFI